MKKLNALVTVLLVFELVLSFFNLRGTIFRNCDSILNRGPADQSGQGFLIAVDQIKTCKILGYPKYQEMVDHLAAITGETYGIAYSDHPFHLVYDGETIKPSGVMGGTGYQTTGLLYGVKSIRMMGCGDPVPTVGPGALLIYPCTR